MNCETIRRKLSAYFDGELRSDLRDSIRNHLGDCPDCSLYYEELKELNRDLKSFLDPIDGDVDSFTPDLLEEARHEFDGTGRPEESGSSFATSLQDNARRSLSVATLLVGIIAGTYLGIGFVNAVTEETVPPNGDAEPAAAPSPMVESASVVSFTDAYFELAEARTGGSRQ